jgi:septal ring factor EnvC (AmiA/AmiB activator)
MQSLLASLHNEVKTTKQSLKNFRKKNKKLKQELASEMANDQPPDRVPRSQLEPLLEKIERLKKAGAPGCLAKQFVLTLWMTG